MKTLTINLTEDSRLGIQASEYMSAADIINMSLNACLSAMNHQLNDAPEELKPDVKEHLFDLFNVTASALLAQFAPEIDLRPDFDYDAILDQSTRNAVSHLKQSKKKRR